MKNIAESIVNYFADCGVTNAFCVTGGAAMHLNSALQTNSSIKVTYNHHESASAMSAEGYARIADKPAILCVTSGPGALNAFNGIFGAYTDSVPMIVLAGQVRSDTQAEQQSQIRQLGDQELRSMQMVPSITKAQFSISNVLELETALPAAWIAATSSRPGPVWIEVPVDIQALPSSQIEIPLPQEEKPREINPADIEAVITHLRAAERPLILAGSGVRIGGAISQLREFAERTKIPLMSAWTHDIFDNKSDLYFGRPGTIGTRDSNLILQQADLLLVLGSRLNIRQVSYNHVSFAKSAKVLQVDVDPNELDKAFPRKDLTIAGDIGEFLSAMMHSIQDSDFEFSAWVNRCRNVASKYSPRMEDYPQRSKLRPNPYLLVKSLFQMARENAIFACGNASACIIPFQIGRISGNQRMFSNSGSASMGYDLPAAIGAAMATKDVDVFAICGDGSIMMNIQELATVVQECLPVKILVLDNSGYLSIRQTQQNFFSAEFGSSKDSGLVFPDFSLVAKAFGLPSVVIEGDDWKGSLNEFVEHPGPILGWAKVDETQGFEPRLKSRLENGQIRTPELDDMFPFLETAELEEIRHYLRGEDQ